MMFTLCLLLGQALPEYRRGNRVWSTGGAWTGYIADSSYAFIRVESRGSRARIYAPEWVYTVKWDDCRRTEERLGGSLRPYWPLN